MNAGYCSQPPVIALSASAPLTPLELIQEQPEVDRLTLPTGATVFSAGEPVQFIHVNERGWMELSSGPFNRIRFGSGELFFMRIWWMAPSVTAVMPQR